MNAYLDMAGLRDVLDRYYSTPNLHATWLLGLRREYPSAYYAVMRLYGPDGISPEKIALEYLTEPFRFRDPLIAEFSSLIERELREQGRLYDGPNVLRPVRFEPERAQLVLQEARYADQCAGFAMDYRTPLFAHTGGTLRGYLEANYPHRHTKEHPLAGSLGVCGILLAEHRALIVHRAAKLASLESSVGPSVAGSVESQPKCDTLYDLISQALGAELIEELDLEPEECTIHPLAYAREVLRGDRPQLFCLVTTDLTQDEISARLEEMPHDEREFDWFRFVDWSATPPESLNFEAAANWYLACEYLA